MEALAVGHHRLNSSHWRRWLPKHPVRTPYPSLGATQDQNQSPIHLGLPTGP